MNWKRFFVILLPVALLSGCYTAPQRPADAMSQRPVMPEQSQAESSTVITPLEERGGIQISAYEPASQANLTPMHSKAVEALLKTANQQARGNDLDGAVGTVERALRIEPRNAYLWHRLANLRMDQGRIVQANDLAVKSMALAGADTDLKRKNWQLIARAKRAVGDAAGARVAERKARMLN